ncbi:MAG: alpha-amylase family glycosyl hydrolase [Clostridium sp.]|nr:alpha-amylase family glycosyl hydrolase [Clostridium sp.]
MTKKFWVKLITSMLTISVIGILTFLVTTNIGVSAASSNEIIVHYYYTGSKSPYVYYWNSLPENMEVEWPGEQMEAESYGNWYTFKFSGKTKVNLIFNDGGAEGTNQTEDLTRNSGEWWYKDGKWTSTNPDIFVQSSGDFREESIYFLMTARFYDGDESNNVHCVEDQRAGNGDGDPAWRGDFKGLIEKLDYIKAMGFSAIWITPIVENGSSYDFHGYHALNFNKVDPRLESEGATYQDLIKACHDKDIKIIQDVVFNHTSNNGERGLFPIISSKYNLGKGVSGNSVEWVKDDPEGKLPSNYESLDPDSQYKSRDQAMKNEDFAYRKAVDIGWEDFTVTTGQFAGDCMELNTENPFVYNYLTDAYSNYIKMGVDAFRIDTVKHISRLTFNKTFIPEFKKVGGENFYMFGEVASRVSEVFNHGVAQCSPFYYTWKESKEYPWNYSSVDGKDNLELCRKAYAESPKGQNDGQRTTNNETLEGNEYHKPDHSEFSGMGVIDYAMHFNFEYASKAFNVGKEEDKYMNDSTYNVLYVDSHDYGPSVNGNDENRYAGGTDNWAENLNLIFTFRGIPCVYYGSEVEFKKGVKCDKGASAPLEDTGRAYFGDHLEGTVTATDFSEYTASGTVSDTLSSPLAKHIQRLNQIRRAIPALQKGQYSTEGVSGGIAYKKRYTDDKVDSYCLVTITDGATFTGILNGTYIDAVTGDTKTVTNGTMSISAPGKGNMRVYVLCNNDKTPIDGKIGTDGTYLK